MTPDEAWAQARGWPVESYDGMLDWHADPLAPYVRIKDRPIIEAAIRASEPLDVMRLARALDITADALRYRPESFVEDGDWAATLAREYAVLAKQEDRS